jgi:hypothetical protein
MGGLEGRIAPLGACWPLRRQPCGVCTYPAGASVGACADFSYINDLRRSSERAIAARDTKRLKSESSVSFTMRGHVFDTGLINKVRAACRVCPRCSSAGCFKQADGVLPSPPLV